MIYTFSITGIIKGGKNNICITRTGHRFPNPVWAKWRDEVVIQLKRQKLSSFKMISSPCKIRIDYKKGDLKRRDVPAILDSIFHCLEKAEIVADDCLIEDVDFVNCGLNRDDPMALMEIELK